MSASKRRIINDDDWLSKSIQRVNQEAEYKEKLRAITALQTRRWEGEDHSPELTTYACLAVSPHQGRPKALERNWASKTGKTWKALTEFPERLVKMADEVERFNGRDPSFFARTRRWNVDRNESSKLSEVCKQLPDSMRLYAKALKERNSYVAKVTPWSGSSKALIDLSEMVKLFTGTYHDRQVADLLNAVAAVLGEPRLFTELSVAQARSRRRNRSAQT